MKKYYRIIFVLGVWVAFVPFFGLPLLTKKILLVIPGALLAIIGIIMSQEHHKNDPHSGISYAEREPEHIIERLEKD